MSQDESRQRLVNSYSNITYYVPEACLDLLHTRKHCGDQAWCRIRVYNDRIHTVPLDSPSLGYLCK